MKIIKSPRLNQHQTQNLNKKEIKQLNKELLMKNFPNDTWFYRSHYYIHKSKAQHQDAFPGQYIISSKANLDRTLQRYLLNHSDVKRFIPQTYKIPISQKQLENIDLNNKYIIKSEQQRGNGIILINNLSEYIQENPQIINKSVKSQKILQKYINNPLLINNKKFDIRFYILVTQIRPLKVFVYDNKLLRLCSEDYEALSNNNKDDKFKHLTNWSVNKNKNIDKKLLKMNFSEGLQIVLCDQDNIKEQFKNYTQQNTCNDLIKELDEKINYVVKHTFYGALPKMLKTKYFKNQYDRFSTVFGGDIMFDDQLNPYLLEINVGPQLGLDLQVDRLIKLPMEEESVNLALFDLQEQYINKQQLKNVDIYTQCANQKIDKFIQKLNQTYNLTQQYLQQLETSLQNIYLEDQIMQHFNRVIPEKQKIKNIKKYLKSNMDIYLAQFYNSNYKCEYKNEL